MPSTVYRIATEAATAKDSLERQGFAFPATPDDLVDLPADVSDIESKDLMAMFSLFTAWADYAHAQEGMAVIAERTGERRLELAEAEAWHALPPNVSVTASRAMVALSPEVRGAKAGLDECYAYRKLVSGLADRYERDAAVLSRELTRRTSENSPRVARRERWGT